MASDRTPLLDRTVSVLAEGYPFALRRRRRSGNAFVTRLMGRRAIGIGGPEAARLFYDEARFERRGALPTPVVDTLFGRGAVHTLDGEAHRARKAMFVALAGPAGLASLKAEVADEWVRAAARWARQSEVVLFDEARVVLATSVCRWVSLPLADADIPAFAADMTAMVDGFGSIGPRHLEARRARRRTEARVGALIDGVRDGTTFVPDGSATALIARHRGPDGQLLDSHTAAVEMLNVIRPTVAVSWYVMFAAHALHASTRRHEHLERGGDEELERFVQEVRRCYPFAPFLGARVRRDFDWSGVHFSRGTLVLLDVYGTLHDPAIWGDAEEFRPERFAEHPVTDFDLIPQGGGDPNTGHRCPGELITVELTKTAVEFLVRGITYDVPSQDLGVSLRRMPARVGSGFRMTNVRPHHAVDVGEQRASREGPDR